MPLRVAGAEASVVALARIALAEGRAALAADNRVVALRWLERAHRLVPHDPTAMLSLASAYLAKDSARAAAFFETVANQHDVRQAWLGLAAARLRTNGPDDAKVPLAVALSRHAFLPDATALADQIVRGAGGAGWCGLRSNGELVVHATIKGDVQVSLDGKPVRGRTLPACWQRGRTIEVRIRGMPMLGSPIQLAAIRRVAGCVEARDGRLQGWAWHPNDPTTDPVLTLMYSSKRLEQTIVATDESTVVPDTGPMARPRSFRLTRIELLDVPGPIHVRGPDGKDLLGSPLDPFSDEAANVKAALRLGEVYSAGRGGGTLSSKSARRPSHCHHETSNLPFRADAPAPGQPIGADNHKRAVTVVIAVHDGGAVVRGCLASVLASVPAATKILVVDDGSEDPSTIAALDDLRRQHKIRLLRHPVAQGFPASANAGIRAAKGRDVVLLNSDTLVPAGWLERLRDAAYSARDIGTVTPLSNDASILSYPGPVGSNPWPDLATTNRVDRLAQRANGGEVVDIPVGVGFCLYLRRDCLSATGALRAGLFAQGYGEENDLCLRARRLGWRNVALTGLFVGHCGGATFGRAAAHLQGRNGRIVEQLHPGYQALIERFTAADPLAAARRRIDILRWRVESRKRPKAVILITHNDGGGVEQRLVRAVLSHAEAGVRAVVLRPAMAAGGKLAIAVRDGVSDDFANLVFAMPDELPALLRILRAARPHATEAHHFADYPSAIYDLVSQLGVPYDVHVHDYAWFCPRVSLVAAHDQYCGEPDIDDCEACIIDHGHFLKENITVAALRHRSATFLSSARRVIVPSEDAGSRMRRQFPGLATVTVPHEDDTLPPTIRRGVDSLAAGRSRPGVCVVGGIGVHKGYDVLLACARDAARRDLDIEFIVVGYTIDDARMMATGRVFVTGEFKAGEAVSLISQQNASLGFVPSIWPETWCLTLNDIWRAGLPAAAFDIGAPAERIRRTGRGFLLPLGLSPSAINNALVAALRRGAPGPTKQAI